MLSYISHQRAIKLVKIRGNAYNCSRGFAQGTYGLIGHRFHQACYRLLYQLKALNRIRCGGGVKFDFAGS